MTGTILVADDHPLFRQALVVAAERVAPGMAVIQAGTVQRAAEHAAGAPDLKLMLLDLKMPGADGFSGIAMLHAERPEVPILVISSAEGLTVAREARRFGAIGFIGKDRDLAAIEAAIGDALAGKVAEEAQQDEVNPVAEKVASLTPMQLKVLLELLRGRLNKQIAYDLQLSEVTVKKHVTALMRRLDVNNRTQAALAARALGLNLNG